jgi:hypothetical protein
MTLLLAMVSLAHAGAVYLNGVRADELPPTTIANATIRVDADGNLWIDAPGYRVTVTEPGSAAPLPATAPGVTARAPARDVGVPLYPPTTGAPPPPAVRPTAAPPVAVAVSAPAAVSSSGSATSSGTAPGTWWLLTVDERSSGHAVDVRVNGTTVHVARSGAPAALLDLGPYLQRGANTVELRPQGGTRASGTLRVVAGRGSPTTAGSLPGLRMDAPQVQYARSAADPLTPRTFTLTVP